MRNKEKINDIIIKIESKSDDLSGICAEITHRYTSELDIYMCEINQLLQSNDDIETSILEKYILKLSNCLYFVNAGVEAVGIKEDLSKMVHKEIYSQARLSSTGTISDRDIQANLVSQQENIVSALYSRAYKKIKIKVESGYEMLNSLKKILSRRIAEYEISNNRFSK